MALTKFTRTVVAGLLIAALPVSATAATRPSAAIPAATAASAAQYDDDDGWSAGWLALAGVAIIWAIAIAVLISDDDDNRSLTRG